MTQPSTPNAVGQRISERLADLEMSPSLLALEAGLSGDAVKKIITGETPLSASKASQFARTLNVSLSWLLSGQGTPARSSR